MMETTHKTLQINSIVFESGDQDVLVKGTVTSGVMTYNTDVLISMSMLNLLISQLQKENESLDFNELLVSEKMDEGQWMYSANLHHVHHRMIDLGSLAPSESLRQIRA